MHSDGNSASLHSFPPVMGYTLEIMKKYLIIIFITMFFIDCDNYYGGKKVVVIKMILA